MSTGITISADLIEGFQASFLWDKYDSPEATPNCHREWWDFFAKPKRFAALCAPRGHAKSTAITHAFTLANVCFRAAKHVLIISDTEKQAIDFLGDIKTELLENDSLREAFGVGEILKDAEAEFAFKFKDGGWARLIAKGSGQKLRGLKYRNSRPDLVIGDDMENEDVVANKERRDKFSRWFLGALIPAISKSGRVRVVGTILHFDSLLERLMRNKRWASKRYAAHNEDFSEILWPEMWPKERLLDFQQTFIDDGKPELYAQEMLNNPIDLSTAFFKKHTLQDMPSVTPAHMRYLIGVDGAFSKADRADYSVLAVVGVDDQGTAHVVDIVRQRLAVDELASEMYRLHRVYNAEAFCIEGGALKHALMPELNRRALLTGTYLPIPDEKFTPTKDKETRAQPLRARINQGGMCFDKDAEWWPALEEELLRFPRGAKDDQVDALAWVCYYIQKYPFGMTQDELEDELWYEEYGDDLVHYDDRDSFTGY